MRTPNSEQKKAIEHNGGILLSAGAGSGKTFVLVEHIIFLLDQYLEANSKLSDIDITNGLRAYLSSIVLMTFTKKAAGELALRLSHRIDDEINHRESLGQNIERWNLAKDALGSMTVSTIHGFCYKLLAQGFFADIDPNVEIISEAKASHRIETLFNKWFETKKIDSDIGIDSYYYSLLSNQRALQEALNGIFGSPDLRLMWKNLKVEEILSEDIEKILSDIIQLSELEDAFSLKVNFAMYDDFADKPWCKNLKGFVELTRHQLNSKETYNAYLDFFNSIKRLTGPTGKAKEAFPEVLEYYESIKKVRSLVKDNAEDFMAYFDHKQESFLDWAKIFKEIFDYIEDHYKEIPGVTFSDLEYYVLKGLDDQEVIDRIFDTYSYFIVDEFQDTSEVQYDILRKMVKNNLGRLFCVGDMKQAIYGFRGGELGVFRECMENIPQNLSMTNNYRSYSNVIEFNNLLFDNIFKKGLSFEGKDKHAVEVEHQKYPFTGDDANYGLIQKLDLVIENVPLTSKGEPKNIESAEYHYVDSKKITDLIKEIKEQSPEEVICILYKNLTPSKFLIPMLIEENIPFTAQIKVPLVQDPIIGFFKILLEAYLDLRKEEGEKTAITSYFSLLLGAYLKYLNVDYKGDSLKVLEQFIDDVHVLGVEESFRKALFALGLSNSNYSNNINLVNSICSMVNGDLDKIFESLKQYGDQKYSIDFQFGKEADKVTIMTTHASKGLEFDHVILGGINNNGRTMPEVNYFGKMPGSYKWKVDSSQKKPFKSPQFIRESLINKQKDFAESKRLFYVACTRAKKNLYWLDFGTGTHDLSGNKESWINGIRSFENDMEDSSFSIRSHMKDNLRRIETSKIEDTNLLNSLGNNPPLFHSDSIGVESKNVDASDSFELGMLSELSVTRLATLSQCPRKFYLKNICKIDDSVLEEILDREVLISNDEKEGREESNLSEYSDEIVVKSSATRGSLIHLEVSKYIKQDDSFGSDLSNKKDKEGVDWITKIIEEKRSSFDLVSEEPIKFSFFGHMISGTPDLLLRPKSKEKFAVWDFKTGRRTEEKEVPYWFQLMTYAYASYSLGFLSVNDEVEISLVYLDEKDFITKTLTFDQVKKSLLDVWSKTAQLNQVNEKHCTSCQYSQLCHFNSDIVAPN